MLRPPHARFPKPTLTKGGASALVLSPKKHPPPPASADERDQRAAKGRQGPKPTNSVLPPWPPSVSSGVVQALVPERISIPKHLTATPCNEKSRTCRALREWS